jgi:DeoR family myo-inositol catabolism operon transcriptional repressor
MVILIEFFLTNVYNITWDKTFAEIYNIYTAHSIDEKEFHMRSKRISDIQDSIYENKTVTWTSLQGVRCFKEYHSRDWRNHIRGKFQENIRRDNFQGQQGLPRSVKETSATWSEEKDRGKGCRTGEDSDVIFIRFGTTTIQYIDYIKDRKNLTVSPATGSDDPSHPLWEYQADHAVRRADRNTLSFTGDTASMVLKSYNISSFHGFRRRIRWWCVTTHPPRVWHQKHRVKRSNSVYHLAAKKIQCSRYLTYCTLDKLTGLIADDNRRRKWGLMEEHGYQAISGTIAYMLKEMRMTHCLSPKCGRLLHCGRGGLLCYTDSVGSCKGYALPCRQWHICIAILGGSNMTTWNHFRSFALHAFDIYFMHFIWKSGRVYKNLEKKK